MSVKLKVIVAVSDNMGIGKNGTLPWRLKKEMAYFTRMTTSTKSSKKRNVVIMGRKTWDSIPENFKPLKGRINFVLSRSHLDFRQYKDVYGFTSLNQAIKKLESSHFQDLYEDVWIIGGSSLYEETMSNPHFYRLYLTRIYKDFDCDTFFPALPENMKRLWPADVPGEMQEEDEIQYTFEIYENLQ